jgi:hypothetical protein
MRNNFDWNEKRFLITLKFNHISFLNTLQVCGRDLNSLGCTQLT